jgi:hypothetical protein
LGGRGRQISEFKASIVYRVSTARAKQRNPVLKNQKKKKKKKSILCVFVREREKEREHIYMGVSYRQF